jgi:hypothetical protein
MEAYNILGINDSLMMFKSGKGSNEGESDLKSKLLG